MADEYSSDIDSSVGSSAPDLTYSYSPNPRDNTAPWLIKLANSGKQVRDENGKFKDSVLFAGKVISTLTKVSGFEDLNRTSWGGGRTKKLVALAKSLMDFYESENSSENEKINKAVDCIIRNAVRLTFKADGTVKKVSIVRTDGNIFGWGKAIAPIKDEDTSFGQDVIQHLLSKKDAYDLAEKDWHHKRSAKLARLEERINNALDHFLGDTMEAVNLSNGFENLKDNPNAYKALLEAVVGRLLSNEGAISRSATSTREGRLKLHVKRTGYLWWRDVPELDLSGVLREHIDPQERISLTRRKTATLGVRGAMLLDRKVMHTKDRPEDVVVYEAETTEQKQMDKGISCFPKRIVINNGEKSGVYCEWKRVDDTKQPATLKYKETRTLPGSVLEQPHGVYEIGTVTTGDDTRDVYITPSQYKGKDNLGLLKKHMKNALKTDALEIEYDEGVGPEMYWEPDNVVGASGVLDIGTGVGPNSTSSTAATQPLSNGNVSHLSSELSNAGSGGHDFSSSFVATTSSNTDHLRDRRSSLPLTSPTEKQQPTKRRAASLSEGGTGTNSFLQNELGKEDSKNSKGKAAADPSDSSSLSSFITS